MGEADLHIERCAVVQRGNVHLRVQDLDLTVGLDVAGGDLAGSYRFNINRLDSFTVQFGQEALHI